MHNFGQFVDFKERQAVRHLKVVAALLERADLTVKKHLGEKSPYVFVYAPKGRLTFDGIRLYSLGEQLCFRIQKHEDTEPFGRAYPVDVEGMFNDLMSDHRNPKKAAELVAKNVAEEVKSFFNQSEKAERELRGQDMARDGMGRVVVRSTGTDYANMVYAKSN